MKLSAPFGSIWLRADDTGLTNISFVETEDVGTNPFVQQAAAELTDYFNGTRQTFTVPLSIHVGTPFQQAVWQALRDIPYGEIRTYKEIAEAVHSPKAMRAIGQANSKNPLPIIIPCHRVIGANGTLTGYLGSSETQGLLIKKSLLLVEDSSRTF